ncbi:GNAT family N-acetyltransferase [Thermodesulfobacteriota bacterium]
MPNFTFLENPTLDQIHQIIDLYRSEAWWTEGADDTNSAAKIVAGSYCFVIATVGNEIIGMGRAISDGASDSYLQDITVKASYRNQGVGSQIIERLVRRLNSAGLKWIGLIAERGSHEFYSRLGFEQMPDSLPMLKKEL